MNIYLFSLDVSHGGYGMRVIAPTEKEAQRLAENEANRFTGGDWREVRLIETFQLRDPGLVRGARIIGGSRE